MKVVRGRGDKKRCATLRAAVRGVRGGGGGHGGKRGYASRFCRDKATDRSGSVGRFMVIDYRPGEVGMLGRGHAGRGGGEVGTVINYRCGK